jgi:hypothetical protein
MTMTSSIITRIIETFRSITVAKVHIAKQVDWRPVFIFENPTVPTFSSTGNWTLKIGHLWVIAHVTSILNGISTLSVLEDRLSWTSKVVLPACTKRLIVIKKRRPSIISALLAVRRESLQIAITPQVCVDRG